MPLSLIGGLLLYFEIFHKLACRFFNIVVILKFGPDIREIATFNSLTMKTKKWYS